MAAETSPVPPFVERVRQLTETDPELQRLAPDEAVVAALMAPGLTLEQLVRTALEGYSERPALAERAYEVFVDPATGRRERHFLPRFDKITYFDLHSRVKGLANAWRFDEHHRVEPGEFVAILGFASTDYTVVDMACLFAGSVSVPLQSTLAGQDLDQIFTDTAAVTVAASVDDLLVAAELAGRHTAIRSVIVLDHDERIDRDRDALSAAQTELARNGSAARLITLAELVSRGDFRTGEPLPDRSSNDDTMVLLLHSSGATGRPKGAVITERVGRFQYLPSVAVPIAVVRLMFAPMNHFQGRVQLYNTLARGGTLYFITRPDMSTLFEDFQLARPTEAAMFPRIMELAHRHYLAEVARRTAESRRNDDEVRSEVMAELRDSQFGDRISLVSMGAAPTPPEVQAFMRECFPITLLEGYGCTEAGGGITVNGRVQRPKVIDYRLRDVPELGYHATDKPYPRGELAVKTQYMIDGYFKQPEATAKLFDEDGFLLTGDIMEEREPDLLVYIDRRNDVMKLSQGEYVAAGNIGTSFENGSPLIAQMFVYGNSSRSYLLAVVVPAMELISQELGEEPDPAEVKALLRREITRVATEANLRSFEVPRDFIVELEPFSYENGLLTSVRKKRRPSLAARYGPALEDVYAELDRRQSDELLELRRDDGSMSVLQRVGRALEISLGLEDLDLSTPYNFADLGGDSLGAAEFSALLSDIFGVTMPANAILSPAGSPMQWAKTIEALRGAEASPRRSFASTHGAAARELKATDLDISRFLDPATMDDAATEEPPTQSRAVLLTGATGFLGRHLALEWLERLAVSGGTLFCVVRASNIEAARRRLADAFAADPELLRRFEELAAEHLEVVVGDIGEPGLGLTGPTYDRLAEETDRIVHPAALVNHLLDYEFLFDANVAGTAELAGLAITRRQKRFDFVSSIAASRFTDHTAGNDEDAPLRHRITLTSDYSSSYGASKWAGEQVLHSLHRHFGVPVNIYRGDMMLPHRRFTGQINAPDIFIRLLFSLVMTGVAPDSFYEPDRDGRRQHGHFDGLPVDFIAAATVGTSLERHRDVRTFHVVNHHAEDGISLDTFVDWVNAAGYPVQRVGAYHDWLATFEQRLNALSAKQRAHSSLGVLDMFRGPTDPAQAMVGSKHFQDAVSRLPGEARVPHLSADFLAKCLADMRSLGLIP